MTYTNLLSKYIPLLCLISIKVSVSFTLYLNKFVYPKHFKFCKITKNVLPLQTIVCPKHLLNKSFFGLVSINNYLFHWE